MRGKAACKRTQQLPTLLRQQCWELLRGCWQWCPNGCNNPQQYWNLQCIVERIQPISLCKPCAMSVRGPNNVEGAVQTGPILLASTQTGVAGLQRIPLPAVPIAVYLAAISFPKANETLLRRRFSSEIYRLTIIRVE